MARKQKDKSKTNDLGFGDIEDSFFSEAEDAFFADGELWSDDDGTAEGPAEGPAKEGAAGVEPSPEAPPPPVVPEPAQEPVSAAEGLALSAPTLDDEGPVPPGIDLEGAPPPVGEETAEVAPVTDDESAEVSLEDDSMSMAAIPLGLGSREEGPRLASLDDETEILSQEEAERILSEGLTAPSAGGPPAHQLAPPVAEEPLAEEPLAEEPVAEEPVAEEPVAEEPVAEEPVAEEPVAEEPVAEEPVAEEPAEEEEEEAAVMVTADELVGAPPDETMILRRKATPDEDLDTSSEDVEAPTAEQEAAPAAPEAGPSDAEVETALAEREARRLAAMSAPPAPSAPAPTTTLEPMAPISRYVPGGAEAERWAEAAIALEREADHTSDASRAATLRAEAGLLRLYRLGDATAAGALLSKAIEGGHQSAEVLAAYGDVVAAQGDFAAVRDLLVQRAGQESPAVAAETLQDAALVARNNLGADQAAVELLERSLELESHSWFALRLLREQHYRRQEWNALVAVLARMAEQADGSQAARIHAERGAIYESHLGDTTAALRSYEAALAVEPGNGPAFLAAERLARQAGDSTRLVALYRAEADRIATSGLSPDRAFWLGRAARLAQAGALEADDTASLFGELLEAAGPGALEARHIFNAWLEEHGRWQELSESLGAELETLPAEHRAPVHYRRAQVLEQKLDDAEGALAELQAAVDAEPGAGPAADEVARLLSKTGRHAELLAFLEAHAANLDDPNLIVTAQYRMGEICEGALDDQDQARAWFERILDIAPGYLPALEGLERVYTRLEAWDQVAAVYEQRALLAEEPAGTALQLHRAGSIYEFRMGDGEKARAFYKRALDQVADFPPSLDAMARILEADDDWQGLAQTLAKAAEATRDSNEVVSLTYRAARVLADRCDDGPGAINQLRRCLELSPGFLPAINLLRELSAATGAWRDVFELQRLEADSTEDLDRRHWRMLVAAQAAAHLDDVDGRAVIFEILEEDASNRAALGVLEQQALAAADLGGLVEVYQRMAATTEDESERTRLATLIADLAADAGDTIAAMQAVSEVVGGEGEGRALAALARVSEGLNYWEEAQRALSAAGDTDSLAEIARLQESYLEDPTAAAASWKQVQEARPDDLRAAAGLERNLAQQGDRSALAAAHGALARLSVAPPVKRVHSMLAGLLYDGLDEPDQAIEFYRLAFELAPGPSKAFSALRRLLAARADGEGIAALFAELPEPMPKALASTLEEAGLAGEAAEVWQGIVDAAEEGSTGQLVALVRLEHDLIEAERFKEAFEALGRRRTLVHHPEERAAIEAKRRWLLAEKLAETDEAWDFYRQLHSEDPSDTGVLEALARIAGARGETELAIEYLDGLATQAEEPAVAARYQRRVAEVHLKQGNTDGAQQAYLRALDHHPEDSEALAGLKTLASEGEDWSSMVGVLAREASVLEGAPRVEALREIARTWEERIGDKGVAADSWRKVLESAPGDQEALRHLVTLTRDEADWSSFVEVARALVQQTKGGEQTALMAELGKVYLKELGREDEALHYLDIASQGDKPSLEAAQLFERMQAARGNWGPVVEALIRQARASEGEQAIRLLERAAQTRLETLHDRDGAAQIYVQLLEIDPVNAEALRFQGDHLYATERFAEAVEVFGRMEEQEAAREVDDFDERIEVAMYFFRFAEALRRVERTEEAIERYEKALEMNASHLPSLEAVGPLYIAAESWKKGAGVYRQILQLTGGTGDPERLARTYTSLGLVEHRLGNLDKAKKRFNKALELRPNDIRALQGIAGVLFARQDWNNLLNVYNNIIYHAQEPGQVVDAYLTKGFVLDAKLQLPAKAAQHYEKSLAFNPNQPAALLRLAELSLRKQDWPEAAGLADRGLSLTSTDSQVKAGLHLVKAVAHGACADDTAARQGLDAALAADATLATVLGETPSHGEIHKVLNERLQARL